jgi:hypothetical protein
VPDYLAPGPPRDLVLRAGPRFAAQARQVLTYLRKRELEEGPLADGDIAQLFWWPLTLRDSPEGLRAHGPEDYCAPTDDLTPLFALLALQLAAAQRIGREPVPFDPDDVVHVATDALDAPEIMLARMAEPPPGSTGWHLRVDGPLQPYEDDYDAMPVRELRHRRIAALWPLALPPGLIVKLRGDEIVSVLDGSGKELWQPADPAAR